MTVPLLEQQILVAEEVVVDIVQLILVKLAAVEW
jgi:hypothetical protein